MQYITLNNGIKMPSIGLGTYGLQGQKSIEIIQNALQIGYKLIDTAQMYENEKEVGIALASAMQSLKDSSLHTKVSRDFSTHSTTYLDSNSIVDSGTTLTSSPHKQSAIENLAKLAQTIQAAHCKEMSFSSLQSFHLICLIKERGKA